MEPTDLTWPAAPQWALTVGAIGRGLVLLGLIAFMVSALSWIFAGKRPSLEKVAKPGFTLGILSVFGSIICLGALFANQQFEYDYVRNSIQAGLEMKYRVAAIWSHQEGSFLLWAVTSALFGLLSARKMGLYRRWFTVTYALFLAALCAILVIETPFALVLTHGQALIPPDGVGLTPSLQNYWVVIHPPTIFMGFGSLTVMFCVAVAALITGNHQDWVKPVRPWALTSLAILGLGLCMGGFWAYETLNWGGFWAWDPVENASFVPWMLTAILTHGLIVQATRKSWTRINLIFAALPFLTFVYGTYLTRSGIYADLGMHTFSHMESSAIKILMGLMGVVTLGFAALYAWKWKSLPASVEETGEGLTRSTGYMAGMLMLSGIAASAALGMSVPLFEFLQGKQPKIVEEPLYHQVVGWFFPGMLLLMGIVPFIKWRGMPWRDLLTKLATVFSFSFMFTGFAVFFMKHPDYGLGLDGTEKVAFPLIHTIPAIYWLSFLIFLCIFATLANASRIYELRKQMRLGWGGFIAHMGVAVLMAGMILSRGFERKDVQVLQPGESVSVMGFVTEFTGFDGKGLSDRENKAKFFMQGQNNSFLATPGMYSYGLDERGEPKWMTWPHIQRMGPQIHIPGTSKNLVLPTHDVYVALSAPQIHLWQDPVSIKVGQSFEQDKVKVTYEKMLMHGKPGQPGTQFGASLKIESLGHTYHAAPYVEIGPDGLVGHYDRVGTDLLVMMQGISATDRSAQIQVDFSRPVYQIEVFYKPMTSLVWLGAGIIFLGSVMSAFYRRKATAPALESEIAPRLEQHAEESGVPVRQM